LRGGHHLALLEGSRAFFPALVEAIESATAQVRLETYIFDFTGESVEVAYALERAARRGVAVMVAVDGVGCPSIPNEWDLRFQAVGVQWETFSPTGAFGLLVPGQWRRLHRKLCVVDGVVGFCGGINVLDDYYDPNYGKLDSPRFDFAVRVTGPLVAQMHAAMLRQWKRLQLMSRIRSAARLTGALASRRSATANAAPPPHLAVERGASQAALVLRDNLRHRAQIERAYLRAIGRAREEIIIANAYFVPGRKLRHALVAAASRGVRVCLLLQGRYEYFMQYYAARPVFGALLRAGVEIHEYSPSFLHAKVAVVDGYWATVGSSNLDPLSLLLAREANVITEDRPFAAQLRSRLVQAMQAQGVRMNAADYEQRPVSQRFKERLAQGVMRILLAIQGKSY
jgi:cardiolipin synthase